MAALLAPGKQQFLDDTGAPLAGGSVAFYIPNTTTPVQTYQDQAQTIPNTIPVQLDSAGRAVIWGSGILRQVVKDANGVTIWDQVITVPLNDTDLQNLPTTQPTVPGKLWNDNGSLEISGNYGIPT